MILNPNDPALNPHRTVAGSEALGTVAIGSDVFVTEVSKLANGMLRSLAVLGNMPEAANYLGENVDVLQDFQDKVDKLHPRAHDIGKAAGIGASAILTTPIVASKALSMASGYLGAATSSLADSGTNKGNPTKDELNHVLTHDDVFLGLIGGATGLLAQKYLHGEAARVSSLLARKLATQLVLPTARSVEAGIEGIPMDNYMPDEYQNIGNLGIRG